MLFFVLLKGVIFGFDSVFSNYAEAIANRSSNISVVGNQISFIDLFIKLLFVGYQATATYGNILVWKALLIFTLLLGCLGVACFFRNRVYVNRQSLLFISILALISVYCLARLFLLPNHSFTHSYLVSRYLFIPLFSIWSFALFCVAHERREAIDNAN